MKSSTKKKNFSHSVEKLLALFFCEPERNDVITSVEEMKFTFVCFYVLFKLKRNEAIARDGLWGKDALWG